MTAVRLEERRAGIEAAAEWLGCSLTQVSTRDLFDEGNDARARLGEASVVWWLGRITFLDESRRLATRVAELAPGLPFVDTPEAVEQSYNLALSYPRLARAGLPQPKTRFLPLSAVEVQGSAQQLSVLLRRRLRWRRVKQAFFRTYYGTRKLHPGMNVAYDKARLCEGAADLVVALRDHQAIGGIAYRELLTIAEAQNASGDAVVLQEYRVFAWRGRPLFWCLDLRADEARRELTPALREACALSADEREQLRVWSTQAAGALDAQFLVIDFARTRERDLVLLEVNPGHSSGWGHPAAFVGVYGQVIAELSGQPPRPPEALSRICAERDVEGLETEGALFGFF